MTTFLSLRKILMSICLIAPGIGAVQAFEPPVFALNDAQLKALEEYAVAKTEKAFAVGPEGQFSAQTGFTSSTIAAREALKACDEGVSDATKRCILIDLNGERLSHAMQMAQRLQIDPGLFDKPMKIPDLVLDIDAWRAREGLRYQPERPMGAILGRRLCRGSREGGARQLQPQ